MKKAQIAKMIVQLKKILFNDEIYASASQLSYSLIMAFIPLTMFTITLASRLTLPVQEIYDYLRFLLPAQAFKSVESIMFEILNSSSFTIITFLPGIYFISIGTRTFMKVCNKAYHMIEKRSFIRSLITSFVFAVLLIILIVISISAIVFGRIILNYVFDLLSIRLWILLTILRYLISFVLMGMIICIIYMAAPNTRLKLRDVFIGAYSAALLWMVGSMIFAYYINNFSNYGLIFGSLGGIFILLGWLYTTSLILLLGVYINSSLYYSKQDISKIDSKKI